MRLLHTYVAGKRRDSGKVEILAEAWHMATACDVSQVSAMHDKLRDSPSAHAVFSHGLFVLENVVRATYEFANPADVKAEAEHARKAELQRKLQLAQERATTAKAAAASASEAEAEIEELTKLLGVTVEVTVETGEPSPSGGNGDGSCVPLTHVPTSEEVLAAGYRPEAVNAIIARAQQEANDAQALLLSAKASGATSLLEHVAALPPGAALSITPAAPPVRLADSVDISKPEVIPTADASTPASPPAADAGGESKPPEKSEPLDLAAAAAKKKPK